MIFAAPWVLLALAALPVLWWLLRVTPPTPRREVFPAIRLLLGLTATAETPSRTPWWLLALRVVAAGLVIVGLARPVLDAGGALPGSGPVLVVVDDGWAAAADWSRRMEGAEELLDRAERAARPVALLTTADPDSGDAPAVSAMMPVADLRARLAALRPKPWAVDRAGATRALGNWKAGGAVVYVADGLTDGAGWPEFARALAGLGLVTELRDPDGCDAAAAAAAGGGGRVGGAGRAIAASAGRYRDRAGGIRGWAGAGAGGRAFRGRGGHGFGADPVAAGIAQSAGAAGAGGTAECGRRGAAR
jgi:hypothetical protein